MYASTRTCNTYANSLLVEKKSLHAKQRTVCQIDWTQYFCIKKHQKQQNKITCQKLYPQHLCTDISKYALDQYAKKLYTQLPATKQIQALQHAPNNLHTN